MEVYMISMMDVPTSQIYRKLCKQSWEVNGYQVKHFEASTGNDSNLPFDFIHYPKFKKKYTEPEMGCFLSHYHLWEKCVRIDRPLLIIEHDAVLVKSLPELNRSQILAFQVMVGLDGSISDKEHLLPKSDNVKNISGSCGYYLLPKDASMLIEKCNKPITQQVDRFLMDAIGFVDFTYIQQFNYPDINTIDHKYDSYKVEYESSN